MWRIIALVIVALIAADMYFVDSKYMNALIQLSREIARSFGWY